MANSSSKFDIWSFCGLEDTTDVGILDGAFAFETDLVVIVPTDGGLYGCTPITCDTSSAP